MIFPDTIRVIYERNPLAEVVGQLRFPRILAIDERLPVDFQEHLGSGYPFVETQEVAQLTFGLGADASPTKRPQYLFTTEDRGHTVTLTSEFISISTRDYKEWGFFDEHLRHALNALSKSYSVPIFQRVGLRYVNIISRKLLNLEGVRWSDLIKPSALGLLAEDDISISDLLELNSATVLQLDSEGRVVTRTALGRTEKYGEELIFVVDNDFFQEGTIKGAQNAIEVCTRFNNSAGRAFRWIIRDQLHEALGPREVAQRG